MIEIKSLPIQVSIISEKLALVVTLLNDTDLDICFTSL